MGKCSLLYFVSRRFLAIIVFFPEVINLNYTTNNSIAVVFGFVRAGSVDAQVRSLIFIQLGQLDAQMFQMQSGHFLIQLIIKKQIKQ